MKSMKRKSSALYFLNTDRHMGKNCMLRKMLRNNISRQEMQSLQAHPVLPEEL